jgi:hypothetical protein
VSDLSLRLLDVYGDPLADAADVIVSAPRTGAIVRRKKDHAARRTLRLAGLDPGEPYLLRAFPVRHRPVQRFVRAPAEGSLPVDMVCPVDPRRVTAVEFPDYDDLGAKARAVLEASHLEHPPRGVSGRALYDSPELDAIPRAGLLNLLAKMERTPLTDGSSVLDHVDSLYRIRGDRVFANVALALRDLVKTTASAGLFRKVSGSLHTPPPGFMDAGSYKTPDPYGNLQVTFFSNPQTLELKADVDIDDAAGIQHAFQVIEHTITGGDTNPYDIHEILVATQLLDPGYTLVT